MPGNASDAQLQDPDRIALLQAAVNRQSAKYDDPQQLIRNLIHKRIWYSTCFGGIFALPGMIPGIGTVAQFVFGFATTFPETDLVRNQMWCLYVELSHVYGRDIKTEDLAFLRKEWHVFRQVNKGEEVFKQAATRQMWRWLSRPRLHQNLQQILVRLGLPEAIIKSMGKSVTRAAPFVLGTTIGAVVNARRVHRFAQSTLRFWHEAEMSDSISLWEEKFIDSRVPGTRLSEKTEIGHAR